MPPPPSKPTRQTIRPSMPSSGLLPTTTNTTLNNTTRNSSAANHTTSRGYTSTSSNANTILQARIAEKKAELENLKQLKELSVELAGQMQALEEKLGTLRDGTEAVGLVLGNWEGVLRAITLAAAAVPQPKGEAQAEETPLPQTLVRIPVQEMDQVRVKDAGE